MPLLTATNHLALMGVHVELSTMWSADRLALLCVVLLVVVVVVVVFTVGDLTRVSATAVGGYSIVLAVA